MKSMFVYVLICSIILYKTKYFVAEKQSYNALLEKKINDVDKTIRLLKADWAYINTPRRISQLAEEQLGMKPISPNQIIEKGKYVH